MEWTAPSLCSLSVSRWKLQIEHFISPLGELSDFMHCLKVVLLQVVVTIMMAIMMITMVVVMIMIAIMGIMMMIMVITLTIILLILMLTIMVFINMIMMILMISMMLSNDDRINAPSSGRTCCYWTLPKTTCT